MTDINDLDAAARLRDAVMDMAKKVIDIEVPKPLIGRVISLDVPHLKAQVWFSGDPGPIEVSLFSSTIPGLSEAMFPSGVTNTSDLQGYGSLVVCHMLNGVMYVTHVLTGGQFSYDFNTLNRGMIAQQYYDSFNGGVQSPIGSKAMGEFVLRLPAVQNDQAVMFGPFTCESDNGEMYGPSWIEVEVYEPEDGCSKSYKFNMYAAMENLSGGGGNKWMNVIPQHETMSTGGGGRNSDLQLSVGRLTTQYGIKRDGTQKQELWFRILVKSLSNSFVYPYVIIRAPWLHKARSVNGEDKFIAQVDANPLKSNGYIGFHLSNGSAALDMNSYHTRDTFNRSVPAGAGDMGTMSDHASGWSIGVGASTDYMVDGDAAAITLTNTNIQRTLDVTVVSSIGYDTDTLAEISISQVATGASIFQNFHLRKTATNTYYRFTVEFTTAGQVNLAISRNNSGVVTPLASTSSVRTYTANTRYRVRAQVKDTKLRMKIWAVNESPPKTWQVVLQSDASPITGTGGFQWGTYSNIGNTNVNPVSRMHDIDIANTSSWGAAQIGKWHTGPWRNGQLRLGNDLQRTMHAEGQFTWDGSNISWTGELFLGGVGANADGLLDSRHYITCPRSGNYQIPIYGKSGVAAAATNANGIPLMPGRALYCAIPPGEWEMDLANHLFLVDEGIALTNPDYNNRLWQYNLPEYAVLIAKRIPNLPDSGVNNFGTMPIKLGTGEYLDNWHNIGAVGEPAFNGGWSNQGGGFSTAAFRKTDPGHVELKGIVTMGATTTAAPSPNIFVLPAGYRPTGVSVFTTINLPAATAAPTPRGIRIETNGNIFATFFAGTINPGPLTLDGIKYSVN